MKRSPLKSSPDKTRDWKQRTAKRLPQVSARRSPENAAYRRLREQFLKDHPICPITGEKTTELHHSAGRRGKWLNLQRYWIALSASGHAYVEANRKAAEAEGLVVRIYETYEEHVVKLSRAEQGTPIYYLRSL